MENFKRVGLWRNYWALYPRIYTNLDKVSRANGPVASPTSLTSVRCVRSRPATGGRWSKARPGCGWTSPPVPDNDIAAECWHDHKLTVAGLATQGPPQKGVTK